MPCSLELLWLIFSSLIELTMFRRIRAMAGLSIVSGSMSCSDRTQSVCLWQFGMLAAPGCQLPMAAKERKAPLILGFCRKALRIGWVFGIVRSPAGNKQKNCFQKGCKGTKRAYNTRPRPGGRSLHETGSDHWGSKPSKPKALKFGQQFVGHRMLRSRVLKTLFNN